MEQKVGSAYIDIEAKLDKLEWRLTTEIKSIAQRSWQGFTSSFSQALWPLKGAIAGVISIGAFTQLSKTIITLADNLEQAHNAFTTILGSAEKAEKMLQDLSNFAAKTPFEIPEIRQNAKQLLAMGVSAENIIPTMKALGDVAAGTGANFSRLALNYGQVITQGHLTGRELRDFAVNGVPLLAELSKMLWKTEVEVQKMISNGEISADMVTKVFEKMTSEGWKFADLMKKQSQTFTGLVSNFQDQLSQVGERIGAELLPRLKQWVEGFSDFVEKNWIKIEEIWGLTGDIILAMGEWVIDLAGTVGSVFDDLADAISEILAWVNSDNNETLSAISGDWSDLLIYIQLGIVGIVNALQIGIQAIWNFWKTVVNAPLNAFNLMWESIKWSLDKVLWWIDWEDTSKAFDWAKEAMKKLKWDFGKDIDDLVTDFTKWAEKLENQLTKTWIWGIERRANASTKAFKKQLDEQQKKKLENLEMRKKAWEELTKEEIKQLENLRKAQNKLNTDFSYLNNNGWGGSGSSKAQKEALKEVKEAYKDIEKAIDDHNDAIEDAQKKVESLNKKYDELKNKAKDAFHEAKNAVKELDGQMEELGKDNAKSMIEKYQKRQDKLKEIERKNKGVGNAAKLKSLEEWRAYDDEKWDSEISTKEIIEYLEIQEEIAFLTKHLSSEQLKQAESLSRMTEAEKDYQKYLEKRGELEYKKASALEKQSIAEAFSKQWEILNPEDIKVFSTEVEGQLKARYQDETGKMVEIVDFKNIQYAQDLFNKSEAIRLEKEALEKKIADEKLANEELTMEKIRLDQYYTNVHAQEINKQKSKLDELIRKYHELAKAKASAGARWARAFGGEVKAGLPYLVGENFKPELFVPSTSGSVVPVNNYNQSRSYHFSGITINTNRGEDFRSEIQNHIGDYT